MRVGDHSASTMAPSWIGIAVSYSTLEKRFTIDWRKLHEVHQNSMLPRKWQRAAQSKSEVYLDSTQDFCVHNADLVIDVPETC